MRHQTTSSARTGHGKQKRDLSQSTIFERLKADHREIKSLCKEICDADRATDDGVLETFEQLKDLVLTHSKAEEAAFYAPLKARSADLKDLALEGFEEHHVAEMLLNEISALSPSDERWMAKMNVLKEALEHHIEEEEDELFSEAREEMERGEAKTMGAEFGSRRNALMHN